MLSEEGPRWALRKVACAGTGTKLKGVCLWGCVTQDRLLLPKACQGSLGHHAWQRSSCAAAVQHYLNMRIPRDTSSATRETLKPGHYF